MDATVNEAVNSSPGVDRWGRWLLCALVIAASGALLPMLAGIADAGGFVIVVIVAAAVALAYRRIGWRSLAVLIAAALAVRVIAAVVLALAAPTSIEQLLGPDSSGYLRIARLFAQRNFHFSAHPVTLLGTADAAAYLLFGGAVWLGADLFALQILNCVFGAMAAGFAFAAARLVVPRYAVVMGLLVAVDPSVVLLSSAGLLKDPMVMCASVMVLWGVVVMFAGPSRGRSWLACAAAASGLAFLHMSRFYVAVYFEAGLLVACAVALFVLDGARRRRMMTLALSSVIVGELVPVMLGWPSSPELFAGQVRHVLGMPAMRYASRGMFDAWLLPAGAPEGTKGTSLQLIDVIRRFFGPFIWIVPSTWDRRTLLYQGDYLLYPGTALWYALIPYLALALAEAPRLVRRDPANRLWLAAMAVFGALYLAQFAAVNLSYRQRDAALPLFLFLIVLGYEASSRFRWWRRAYVGYWSALALMAAAHLAVKLATGAGLT